MRIIDRPIISIFFFSIIIIIFLQSLFYWLSVDNHVINSDHYYSWHSCWIIVHKLCPCVPNKLAVEYIFIFGKTSIMYSLCLDYIVCFYKVGCVICLQEVTTGGFFCGTWRRPSMLGQSRWNWRASTCPTSSAWPSTAPTKRFSLAVRSNT